MGEPPESELYSVTLTVYNHADEVVQNKAYYLSLLCMSAGTLKSSFAQPGLFYAYYVLRASGHAILPVFEVGPAGNLTMFTLFKNTVVHIGENCLRMLTDNLPEYVITLDCVKQTYVLRFTPTHPERPMVNMRETQICEAVAALDLTDELREDISRGLALVLSLPPSDIPGEILAANLPEVRL